MGFYSTNAFTGFQAMWVKPGCHQLPVSISLSARHPACPRTSAAGPLLGLHNQKELPKVPESELLCSKPTSNGLVKLVMMLTELEAKNTLCFSKRSSRGQMQNVFSLGLSKYVSLRKKAVKKFLFLITDPVSNKSYKTYNLLTALITK